MPRRTPQTYYQLLDIAPDAKREEIALGYQRALEAPAQEHETDPTRRAALRKAFEVLTDPIQRMSYDLGARTRLSGGDFDRASNDDDLNDTQTIGERIWGSTWAKALIAGLILIAIVMWRKSGPISSANAPARGMAPPLSSGGSTASDARIGGATTPQAESRSIPAAATPTGPRSAEDIFNQVSLSVVRINVANAAGVTVASGSGVVIGPGSVVTNCHVALRGEALEVTLNAASYSASVEVANEERDLCLLNVPGLVAPAVSLGSVDSLRVGQRVYAVGAPQGLDLTISDGIISALRDVPDGKMIQTSAPVSPGSSGGGLFDTSGRMVGVVTFQTKVGQNLNFAVPADWVSEMRTR